MSHNASKINSVEPSAASTYSVPISPQMIMIGRGEADAYANSGQSLNLNSSCAFYDQAPINTITGASLTGSGDWYYQIQLPAGRYVLRAYFSALFSASGALGFGLYNGSSYVGGRAYIGASVSASTDGASFASAAVTITTPTTFTVRIFSLSNVSAVASQGNIPAEESWLCIERQT